MSFHFLRSSSLIGDKLSSFGSSDDPLGLFLENGAVVGSRQLVFRAGGSRPLTQIFLGPRFSSCDGKKWSALSFVFTLCLSD